MNFSIIENLMYQASHWFLMPVLISIVLMFFYTWFVLGMFSWQIVQRYFNKNDYLTMTRKKESSKQIQPVQGYQLFSLIANKPEASNDELDVYALTQLDTMRSVTRIAPMMGLIATMIPMGPALQSLADGNVQGISENLIVAFSAIIFSLMAAAVTFWIGSVKKRWMAQELIDAEPFRQS